MDAADARQADAPASSRPTSDPSWRESLGAFVVALVGAALLFAPALVGERCVLSFELDDPRFDIRPWAAPGAAEVAPVNPITPDADLFVLPGMVRMRQMLAAGAMPWWDGGQLLGYPLAGNVPYPLWSPLTWPGLLLDPISAMDVTLWLHTAVAAWLAWRAARLFGVRPSAAWVAGAGFALSTWMVTRWHLPQIQHTSVWWPGLLCASEWWRRRAWARGVAEGGAALGLSMLSGFPQVAVALAGGWGLWTLLDRDLRRPRALASFALAGVVGACLAAPAFVTAAAAYAPSLRATEATRAATSRQGLPPTALVGAVLPEAFGLPADFSMPDAPAPTMDEHFPQREFWSDDLQDNVVENALYPGALVLLLLLAVGRRGVDPRARRLVALGALVVGATIVWPAVADLPGIEALGAGNVKRVLVLWAGTLPLAAALVLDAIVADRARVPALASAVAIGLVAVSPLAVTYLDAPGAVAYADLLWGHVGAQTAWLILALVALMRVSRDQRWTLLLPALVLAADLSWHARRFNPFPLQESAFPATAVVEALVEAAGDGRVAVLGDPNLAPPTATTLFGVRSVHGAAPMVSARVVELLELVEDGLVDPRDPRIVEPFEDVASLGHPLLDRLGVTLVVHGDAGLVEASPERAAFASEVAVLAGLRRDGAYPRAWTTRDLRVIPDRAARLAALDAGLDPGEAVVEVSAASLGITPVDQAAPRAAERVEVAPNAITVDLAPTDAPRLLVVSEAWDPGWRATVDGEPADVVVVDHALSGVVVGAGGTRVALRYEPVGWDAALALLAAGLVGWGAVVVIAAARRRAASA